MHLAQINIGIPKYDLGDSRIADFVNNLNRINAMAQKMPGFVWMLKDENGNATGIQTPFDRNVIANMSVWETPEHLETFVWKTVHQRFYNRKAEWFEKLKSNHFVMWWIEEGHVPTLVEAKQRLDHLEVNGDTDHAFGWSYLPQVKLWRERKCG